jgi:hypothetical protein
MVSLERRRELNEPIKMLRMKDERGEVFYVDAREVVAVYRSSEGGWIVDVRYDNEGSFDVSEKSAKALMRLFDAGAEVLDVTGDVPVEAAGAWR